MGGKCILENNQNYPSFFLAIFSDKTDSWEKFFAITYVTSKSTINSQVHLTKLGSERKLTSFERYKLALVEVGISSVKLHEFIMTTLLDDITVLHIEDMVGISNRR